MGSARARRFGGEILSKCVAGALALSIGAASVEASWTKTLVACHTMFDEATDALDAMPFTKKIMDRTLSKKWVERFDPSIYYRERARFLAMENMQLDEWDFAETRLAYLSALIERGTGMKVTLTEMFLEDPTHARALQLLVKDMNFTKNLSRFQLESIVERAFMLTGKLDLELRDIFHMNSERVHLIMVEHVWKDMAKIGVIDVYEKMGLLVYTKKDVERMLKDYVAAEAKAGRVPDPAEIARIRGLKTETRFAKWKRWAHHPAVKAGLLLPTWNPAIVAAKLRPGVIPEVQWVRFSSEELEKCLEIGAENCVKLMRGRMTKQLITQRSYDFVRHVVAIWAGVFTFGYALGEIYGLEPAEVQDWIAKQGTRAVESLRAEYEKIRDTSDLAPFAP